MPLVSRLRLTLMYGGLFFGCGVILLAVMYLLVEHAINPGHIDKANLPPGDVSISGTGLFSKENLPAGPLPDLSSLESALAKQMAASDLRQVLIDAPIALTIVTVIALALGWVVAGRVLRPLTVITTAARRISASSLHQRLGLRGPDDELKALGDTLDELFERLESSFEAQRNFVANASHELRTPITRERALLQVALDDPGTTAETWRAIAAEVLASNAEQEGVLEALLTLASSQGGLDEREPVDLAAVTGEVLLAAAPEAARQGLSVDVATTCAPLLGDKTLARRLVVNLVDNAMRHNVAGGKVEVSIEAKGGRAVLEVTNTGPIVPPEAVNQLFQPFLRLDGRRVRRDNGHGLGLSIVDAIATAHGAEVIARARTGGGLSIKVAFPAVPAASPPALAASTSAH